jgi:hypothetical protein
MLTFEHNQYPFKTEQQKIKNRTSSMGCTEHRWLAKAHRLLWLRKTRGPVKVAPRFLRVGAERFPGLLNVSARVVELSEVLEGGQQARLFEFQRKFSLGNYHGLIILSLPISIPV